jgi:hypothetical protein
LREGQKAIEIMTTLYEQEMNVGAVDLKIFERPLATRIHDKTLSIKNWIKNNNERSVEPQATAEQQVEFGTRQCCTALKV